MPQITGAGGPAANGQVTRQQNSQNLAQQRIPERTRTQGANTGQNNIAETGQAKRPAGPANKQNGPEQNLGGNVNIVV